MNENLIKIFKKRGGKTVPYRKMPTEKSWDTVELEYYHFGTIIVKIGIIRLYSV